MTLDQRASRNATRRNNRLKKRYPLFFAEWQTSIDAERERLARYDSYQRQLQSEYARDRQRWSDRAALRGNYRVEGGSAEIIWRRYDS